MTNPRPTLKNLEALIEGRGDITVGRIGPIPCIATAGDEDLTYAMLQRRPSESLLQLLERLDATLAWAWEHEETVDEINSPQTAPPTAAHARASPPARPHAKRRPSPRRMIKPTRRGR